jgi:hypothetical protein
MQAARDRVRELTPLQRIGLPISMVVQDLNRFGWVGCVLPTRQLDPATEQPHWYVQNRLCRFIGRKFGRRRYWSWISSDAGLDDAAGTASARWNGGIRLGEGRRVDATGEPCDRKGHARFDGEALETGELYGSVDLCARRETTGTSSRTYGVPPHRASASPYASATTWQSYQSDPNCTSE